MKYPLSYAVSGMTLALGLSLGGAAWAGSVYTYPTPDPVISVNGVASSFGPAVGGDDTISGDPSTNTVTVGSGSVAGYVVGGVDLDDATAVNGNRVFISGGAVGNAIFGGWALGAATNNNVTISGGDASGSAFFSGFATYGVGAVGGMGATATGNGVTIDGGTVDSGVVVGGMGNSSATGNTVTVNGGTINGIGLVGGFTIDNTNSAAATGNQITITGGTVSGGIVGGRVYAPCSFFGTDTFVSSNNTVTISGTPDLSNSSLIGGAVIFLSTIPTPCSIPVGATTIANNTLNLDTTGLTVAGVSAFNNINFHLPATLDSTPVLATAGVVDISAAAITVDASAATLTDGATYTLLSAGAGLLSTPVGGFTPVTGTLKDATSTTYNYTLSVSGDTLLLKIGGPLATTPATAVPATSPATLALLALLLSGVAVWFGRRNAARA